MKRTIGILVTFLALGMVVSYAQEEEGFWTRCIMIDNGCTLQVTGKIECWRSSNQSPNEELVGIRTYAPLSPTWPQFLRWWVNGTPRIEYNWDYSFIGWTLQSNGDTLFSDYTAWTHYDPGVCDTFDLDLTQTTRPHRPPRP